MKLSDAIQKIIPLARAMREYWATELPKRHRDYPLANPGEQPPPAPAEEKKLAKLFANLPPDMVYQIGLLMYLGRGDFDARELGDQFQMLKESFDDAENLAIMLIGKATLADYLQDGLAELAKHHIDVDRMPLDTAILATPTRAR